MKPTLLVVIDALTTRVIQPAMDQGRLPGLTELVERGTIREECTSIFPSITPAATASIITGKYPCDHGISGAYFYNTDTDCVRYFGTDFWAIQKESFASYFQDYLQSTPKSSKHPRSFSTPSEPDDRRGASTT